MTISVNDPQPSLVDTRNSSTAILASGAVFTGEWIDASGFPAISIALKTDQNGTLTIQFSPDGENADSTLTRYYRTTQIEPPHIFRITRRFCRVTFTNTSASSQTYFRLQSIFVQAGALNAPTDSVLSQDYDATIVRPTNFNYEVALSRRQGYTTWNKWGYNADIDVGTETVWANGGLLTRLTTASTLNIVSSSADDASPSGIGALTLSISGVDANYDTQTETVTLNGTSNVVTATTWLGINRAAVITAGSSSTNVGAITITAVTGGSVQAYIPIAASSTQQAFFFVANNHVALMDWLYINVVKISGGGGSPLVTSKCFIYSHVSGVRSEILRDYLDTSVDNHDAILPSQPFVVGEKSLVEFQATTDLNNTAVSIRFSLILVREVDA